MISTNFQFPPLSCIRPKLRVLISELHVSRNVHSVVLQSMKDITNSEVSNVLWLKRCFSICGIGEIRPPSATCAGHMVVFSVCREKQELEGHAFFKCSKINQTTRACLAKQQPRLALLPLHIMMAERCIVCLDWVSRTATVLRNKGIHRRVMVRPRRARITCANCT